jgi:hypothetical protein
MNIKYEREELIMDSDGVICLDWVRNVNSKAIILLYPGIYLFFEKLRSYRRI